MKKNERERNRERKGKMNEETIERFPKTKRKKETDVITTEEQKIHMKFASFQQSFH
jgi:hypothetical protein